MCYVLIFFLLEKDKTMNIQQTGDECLSKILFNLLTNEETNDELVARCYN